MPQSGVIVRSPLTSVDGCLMTRTSQIPIALHYALIGALALAVGPTWAATASDESPTPRPLVDWELPASATKQSAEFPSLFDEQSLFVVPPKLPAARRGLMIAAPDAVRPRRVAAVIPPPVQYGPMIWMLIAALLGVGLAIGGTRAAISIYARRPRPALTARGLAVVQDPVTGMLLLQRPDRADTVRTLRYDRQREREVSEAAAQFIPEAPLDPRMATELTHRIATKHQEKTEQRRVSTERRERNGHA